MRTIILNDTRPGHHPGCQLVMQQLINGCHSIGLKVIATLPTNRWLMPRLRKCLPGADIIIMNGEGTLHHDRPGAQMLLAAGILAHQHGIPIVLVNTIWEGNHTTTRLLPLTELRYTRESYSSQAMQRAGFTSAVVPDLMLTSNLKPLAPKFWATTAPSLSPIIVTDDVCWEKACLLARFARQKGLPFYRMSARPALHSLRALAHWLYLWKVGGYRAQLRVGRLHMLQSAGLVVTGRFHAVCFAILCQRPFVTLTSNSHKIEGLIADAQLGDCAELIPDEDLANKPLLRIEQALSIVGSAAADVNRFKIYQESCRAYIQRAHDGAETMFAAIAALEAIKRP